MSDILTIVWHGFMAATWIQQSATILGLVSVWLATRQIVWVFPLGLVQVVLFGYVLFHQQLYADTFLQGCYFVALIYGWWSWTHPGERRGALPVTHLSQRQLLALVMLIAVVTVAWSQLLADIGDAMPWRDAFLATCGICAQWLEARKKIEAWLGWVIVNTLGLVMMLELGLYWFVVLYILYLVLSFTGLRAWLASYRGNHHEPAHA